MEESDIFRFPEEQEGEERLRGMTAEELISALSRLERTLPTAPDPTTGDKRRQAVNILTVLEQETARFLAAERGKTDVFGHLRNANGIFTRTTAECRPSCRMEQNGWSPFAPGKTAGIPLTVTRNGQFSDCRRACTVIPPLPMRRAHCQSDSGKRRTDRRGRPNASRACRHICVPLCGKQSPHIASVPCRFRMRGTVEKPRKRDSSWRWSES